MERVARVAPTMVCDKQFELVSRSETSALHRMHLYFIASWFSIAFQKGLRFLHSRQDDFRKLIVHCSIEKPIQAIGGISAGHLASASKEVAPPHKYKLPVRSGVTRINL